MYRKTYIAIDLKSFYASVECVERHLDPLTTNLVVADVSRTEKTICLAVSPSLKAYGLSGRSRLFEVVQKSREVKLKTGKTLEYIAATPRMSLYIKYSADIYSVYLKYFSPDDIHVYSIDEVFIDATSYLKLYKMNAHQLTQKVIEDVFKTTGITATAGIATNLFLCKVAMDIVAKHIPADKNGVRIAELNELEFRKKLWVHKPITDFWRIGPGTANRLYKIGAYTMGDIARISVRNENLLYKIFGIDAEILIDHAWGIEPCSIADIKQYHSKSNCLSSGQVLQQPYPFEKARIVAREMADLMAFELFKKNIVASSMTLTIGYEQIDTADNYGAVESSRTQNSKDFCTDCYGRIIPKPAHGTVTFNSETNCSREIADEIVRLFDRIINRNLMIRRFSLSANNVVSKGGGQLSLFADERAEEKDEKLKEAMLSLQKRYGKNTILKGMNLEEGATTVMRNSQIGGHRA